MKYAIIIFSVLLITVVIIYIKTTSFTAKIRRAEEHLEAGLISKASEIVRKILARKNDYVPARYLRALILMKQNQYLLAISEFNAVLGLQNFNKFINEIDIHYHLARLYNETKNFPKEIDEYKIILTFNPDDLTANHRIGHALYKKKEYKRAFEHLSKTIAIDPNYSDVYLPLGISCYYISEYEKSEDYLTKALNVPGDHSDAQFYLGLIYQMKKDYTNAITMFDTAKRDRKYFLKCLYKIGEIYFQNDEHESAVETLEQGLASLNDSSDESMEYRYLLAESYEHQNKIKEAFHHWSKIAETNPNYRNTRLKLESYQEIMNNDNLMTMFISSLEALQPTIIELISGLNYNIITKERISPNEYTYKAYNIKRINDPPILIYFNRTTREITEETINEFQKIITQEKCKNGMYITTSKFSLRAKAIAQAKSIELYDSEYIKRIVEKIRTRKKMK